MQGPGSFAPPVQTGLTGERKLRWVCQQLRLTTEQMKQADALIAIYNQEVEEEKKGAVELMKTIVDKYAQMKAAETAGNTEEAARIKTEIKAMGLGTKPEAAFFENLTPQLTDEQKQKLPALRERASKSGESSLRPIHVLRAARGLDLTAEQREKLEQVLDTFRNGLRTTPPRAPEQFDERLDQFIQDVRAVLTPQQAQKYDEQVTLLRVTAPAPGPIHIPGMPEPKIAPAPPATRPAPPAVRPAPTTAPSPRAEPRPPPPGKN